MEIDTQTREKLIERLAILPPKAAIALLREVQIDELRGDDTYPHEIVTRQLIENLAKRGFRSELLGQPWVLFCEPFDAFLVDKKNDPKNRGAILRKSVTVIWKWLMTELFHDELPDLEVAIIQALSENRTDHAKALMSAFHKKAGDRIWSELSAVEKGSRLYLSYNTKFGVSGVFEDALEVARILQIAPALIHLRHHVQQGLTFNQDEDIRQCHHLYKNFLQSADDHIELGMLLISRRLATPHEILKLLQYHTGTELDSVILEDPASVSATSVLSDLECSINEAIRLIAQYKDFPLVAKKLTGFYDCIELFTSLIELSPKTVWGSKIIQIRKHLSSAIIEQIEQLPRIINTLRYKSTAQQTSSSNFDGESGPNAYDVSQAIYIANLLRLSGKQLKQLSLNEAFTRVNTECNNFIETIAEVIVNELAKGDANEKKDILKFFNPIVDLTLILQGEEMASLLERRGDSAFRSKPVVK